MPSTNLTGLSPEQIAQISHGDLQNVQVRNQTLGQIYGMFDKQQDNFRADQQQQLNDAIKAREFQLKQLEAQAMIEKRYADVTKIQEELKLLPLKAQQLQASAASGFASANEHNINAAIKPKEFQLKLLGEQALREKRYADVAKINAEIALLPLKEQQIQTNIDNMRDQIGTHGQYTQTYQDPETGEYRKARFDKSGKPIKDFGAATLKDIGSEKPTSDKVMQQAYSDLQKSISFTDRDGKVTYKSTIPQIAVDKYNSVAKKTGERLMQKLQLQKPGTVYGTNPIELVAPEGATLRDIRDILINDYELSISDAEETLKKYAR